MRAGTRPLVEIARAKVNLTLAVLGRHPNGYHEIESIVAFAQDVADRVLFDPGGAVGARVEGPFAASLVGRNIVSAALDALGRAAPGLVLGAVNIEKNIPVAAGLGGGSADAAALLRAVRRANPALATEVDWHGIARALGADVPVCLEDRAAVMRGIGEDVTPLADMPALFAVLVNPLVPVPPDKTAQVFRMLAAPAIDAGAAVITGGADSPPPSLPREGGGTASSKRSPRGFKFPFNSAILADAAVRLARRGPSPLAGEARRGGIPTLKAAMASAFSTILAADGNDLETPARALMPEIARVIDALRQTCGCRVARLSGAGPTCFGLFKSLEAANAARREIERVQPAWWVRTSVLR